MLRLVLSTALFAALALPAVGFGRHGFRGHHGPPGERVGAYADALGIEGERRDLLLSIVDEARPLGEDLHAQLREARSTLRGLIDEGAEESAVMVQADAVAALRADLDRLRVKTLLRLRSQLSDEEWETWRALHREARPMRAVMEACADEYRALCADSEVGGSPRECMRDNEHILSDSCREAMEGARSRFGRFHDRGPESDQPPVN